LVPVVMDFGLAREAGEGQGLTESGAVMGTPAFMSPEQARGEARHLDRRSDVYSLGATLFDVLTGQAPFEDATVVNVILSVMTKEAPLLRSLNASLPEALETICARCLTKDKEQRYPTALALAEDLTRFLSSEKIVAKKVGLAYRLMWRARQNKPAAALVLSLLVSVLGFAVYGLRARYVAQKQAELSRQIAQDSKDIEWLVRTAYALPLHNVEREQAMVRKRMEQVESRLRSYGELGAGLAHYALGRGHLSLHESKRARFHLEEAHRLGERAPELYAALGRVLGELYHEALLEARRSGEKTWVEQRQKELAHELLLPATASLQKALARRGELSLDSPFYIEGLLSFYAGRFPEADHNAQLALSQTPWLSEAAKLRGEIAQAQALAKISDGKHEEARTLLGQALGHYQQAADISRSDGQIHAALARAELDLAEVDRFQGKPQDQEFAAALAAAERTITALPSDGSGYLEQARVLYFTAKSGRFKGNNKTETYDQAISFARQAIVRNAKDFLAWDLLGNALIWRGVRAQIANQDPEPFWKQADEALDTALAIAPNFPWAHNDRGVCAASRGNRLLAQGADPRPRYREAIQFAKRAVEQDPKYLFAYNTILLALGQYADYSLEHGQDFDDLIAESTQLGDRCGAGCANYLIFQRNMAGVWLNQALHQLRKQVDPQAAIARARSYLTSVRKLDSNLYTECLFSRYADTAEAEWRLKTKLDPSELVAAALAAVQTCKEFDKKAEDPFMLEARLLLVRAQWLIRQGQPEEGVLTAALSAATQAIELNAEKPESFHEKARAAYLLAKRASGAARETRLSEAMAAVTQGLKASASSGPLWAMLAVLLSEQASSQRDRALADSLQKQSEESWQKALAINPIIKRDYADFLQDK
jgi:serine/threonine-protein kinase